MYVIHACIVDKESCNYYGGGEVGLSDDALITGYR